LLFCAVSFSVVSFAQNFSITIDAEKDSIYKTLTEPSNGVVYIPSRAYLRDVGTPPENDADLSAIVWFAYDETYLYCYAEVKDDIVRATNAARFENDCLELKFDPNPRAGAGTATSNSRITAKGTDDAEDPNGVDNLNGSGNLENENGTDYVVQPDDYARKLTDDGYVVEFRVPFLYINEKEDNRFMIERDVDSTFGLAINIGDNDDASRSSMIQWSAGFTDQAHSNAMYLGSATFLADHKIKLTAVSPRADTIKNDSAEVWYTNIPTGVKREPLVSKSFELFANYPNPFNPATTIKFSIPSESHVSLTVYIILGREVAQLISEKLSAGIHTITWDASGFASGVYFYRLNAGQYTAAKKLTLLK